MGKLKASNFLKHREEAIKFRELSHYYLSRLRFKYIPPQMHASWACKPETVGQSKGQLHSNHGVFYSALLSDHTGIGD